MFLQCRMEAVVEQAYWLRRQREELALAGTTTCAEAKLIHLDLAGRYSVKAAEEALRTRTANIETAAETGGRVESRSIAYEQGKRQSLTRAL